MNTGTEVEREEEASDSLRDWAEFLDAVCLISFLALEL
jgi:hypothetical protein